VKKYATSILAALALGALSFGATADPIGPTCDNGNNTCQGSLYAITYSGTALPDSDPDNETFRIFLDINTTGYNGGGSFLTEVAIKVSSASAFVDAALVSPASGWTEVDGGINASGCDGSGGGFACAKFTGLPADRLAVPDGTYEWVFDITVTNGDLFTDPLASSIKARYVDANGGKVGDLVSENITLQTGGCPPTVCLPQIVPEPTTLALLGIALLGAGFVGTGRRKA
jgi:hypothetical protein